MEIITGVSKSALSRIEKGEVALDLDVAEMIADGLHIGIDIMMNHIHFISDETAATVLELALKIEEMEGGK